MKKKNTELSAKLNSKTTISPLALKNELNALSNEDLFIRISNMDEDERRKVWTLLDDDKCAKILEDSGSPLVWFLEMTTKKPRIFSLLWTRRREE